MAWFSKKREDASKVREDSNRRQDPRFSGQGECAAILDDSGRAILACDVGDLSISGMRLEKYSGPLRGGQYFEFKLTGAVGEPPPECIGYANIIRVKDENLAAKFSQPQPALKNFLLDYFDAVSAR